MDFRLNFLHFTIEKTQIFKIDIVLIFLSISRFRDWAGPALAWESYIFYYQIQIFGPFLQAFLKTSILEHSEALHIVRIANITKPLWILYQISKLFLNFR